MADAIGAPPEVVRELREKVAMSCRILHLMGLADYLGHPSARIPGTDRIVIKPRHSPRVTSMSLMTPEQMVVVDLDGRLIDGEDPPPSETVLHTETYRARPDVGGVVHTHQMMVTSFGIAGREIQPVLHVDSPVLLSGQPVFQAPDLIMKPEEGRAVAEALGQASFCHLRNHGIVVVGPTIEEATLNCIYLERLAVANFNAAQLGHVHAIPWDQVRDLTRQVQGPAGRWAYYKALVEERERWRS